MPRTFNLTTLLQQNQNKLFASITIMINNNNIIIASASIMVGCPGDSSVQFHLNGNIKRAQRDGTKGEGLEGTIK